MYLALSFATCLTFQWIVLFQAWWSESKIQQNSVHVKSPPESWKLQIFKTVCLDFPLKRGNFENIARGTTDPGYWLFNLSYLSIVFSTCIVFVFPRYLSIFVLYLCLFCICQWWRHDPWQVGWPGGGWHSLDTTAARMTMMMMMMMLVMIFWSTFITILSTFIYFIKSFTTFIHFHPLSFFGPLFQTLFGIMIFWNNDPGVLSYIEADEERTA